MMPTYLRNPCPMSLRASLLLFHCCAHVEAARERGDLVEMADRDRVCRCWRGDPSGGGGMSERYNIDGEGTWGCRDCGSAVDLVTAHDAFHDRIDRLEDRLSPPVTDRVAEPDPEPPFPMGAKVGGRESGVEWGTVTSWDFYPAWGHWFVRVDRVDDDGEPFYQLHHPSELELVPENPDTPPPAENPDKPNVAESGTEPLRCAVCGEPVGFEASPEAPPVLWHLGYKGVPVSSDHAATLTPPERAETYDADTEPPIGSVVRCEGCGNVYVHRPRGWLDTDSGLSHWWDELPRPSCGPLRVIYGPGDGR